ncbi:retropepsin-like aspartic protease [Mucilaginibacter jinjuensis]|uniref:Retropepsin-like aspartic protease n=1 Tax=Mucilaginibacter jinjuensis TaxID=1176721 RepID=A0ABY7T341_9SPHI|nr:retropepsin-like aspartic protease [Mucilaginibacter jinjuensis]WCT10678.1 retropepsin-like aspartic protease [Mucilaginibacter jinjuensis]
MKFKVFKLTLLLTVCFQVATKAQIANDSLQNKPSKLCATIPFEVLNGSIILSVKLNNNPRILRMLFDTGADGMAISEDLADTLGIKATRTKSASVVGGHADVSIAEGNMLHLDGFDFPNQNIALFKTTHKGTDGIIGNQLTKRYIVKVDFDKQQISLYTFGNYQYGKDGESVLVKLSGGIIVVPATLNVTADQANNGEFVFDTGAGYNLICFRPFVVKNRLLVNGFKPESMGSTTSMGVTTPTFNGKASAFTIGSLTPIKDMPIGLMSTGGSSESWNPGVDGSIGIRLISHYNFTINLQQQLIHFTPRANPSKS